MKIWIVYFWFIAILVAISAIGRIYLFAKRDAVTIFDLIESLISLVAIVGLYGFAYQMPLVSALFWKMIWFLLLMTWLWSLFGAKNVEMIEKIGMANGTAVIALTSAIGIPTLVGLLFYSFRSDSLWNR